MAKHIGIVACSAEGAALCYRTICAEAPREMGEHRHPEITMHTHPLSEYMVHIRAGDWDGVGQLMVSSAQKVAQAGADFAICPDNTIHQAFDIVQSKSPIPWLHIAEVVADEARRRGFTHLGILGTKYLMTGPVYPSALKKSGIVSEIPEEEDRGRHDRSRLYFNQVIQRLKHRACDAVVLGCTEIPLIVNPNDCPLPTLDSTRLLARAAIREVLGEA
jgi:aspartate racemase